MAEFIINTFIEYTALVLVSFYILFQSRFFYRLEAKKSKKAHIKCMVIWELKTIKR